MPPTVLAKLFFIFIFLIIKIYCFQKTLRAENFVIAVGGRPRFPFEVSEVIKKIYVKSTITAVAKVSSCRVDTTSRQGIKLLGISFGSIFLLFSFGSSRGATFLYNPD